MPMIKLIGLEPTGDFELELHFGDGSRGVWSTAELIARDTVLTHPLADPPISAAPSSKRARWPGPTGWSYPWTDCTVAWPKPERLSVRPPEILTRGGRFGDVRFDSERLIVDLADGRTIAVPLALYPRLLEATPAQRSNWTKFGGGFGIHWPDVDEDLSVAV
jgi:hypothetical protein